MRIVTEYRILYSADVVMYMVRSFVRYCGQGSSLLWIPALRPFYVGPMRQPRERRGIARCVRCMCELCRVEEGLSRREQLVRYF